MVEATVNRMIWYRFKRRGIEIPFPMSDKLLNDFMEVVQTQGRQPAPAADLARIADQLRSSDLGAKLVSTSRDGRCWTVRISPPGPARPPRPVHAGGDPVPAGPTGRFLLRACPRETGRDGAQRGGGESRRIFPGTRALVGR